MIKELTQTNLTSIAKAINEVDNKQSNIGN